MNLVALCQFISPRHESAPPPKKSHVETLVIYELGFNQTYYTYAFILLIKIVLCSVSYQITGEFHWGV